MENLYANNTLPVCCVWVDISWAESVWLCMVSVHFKWPDRSLAMTGAPCVILQCHACFGKPWIASKCFIPHCYYNCIIIGLKVTTSGWVCYNKCGKHSALTARWFGWIQATQPPQITGNYYPGNKELHYQLVRIKMLIVQMSKSFLSIIIAVNKATH